MLWMRVMFSSLHTCWLHWTCILRVVSFCILFSCFCFFFFLLTLMKKREFYENRWVYSLDRFSQSVMLCLFKKCVEGAQTKNVHHKWTKCFNIYFVGGVSEHWLMRKHFKKSFFFWGVLFFPLPFVGFHCSALLQFVPKLNANLWIKFSFPFIIIRSIHFKASKFFFSLSVRRVHINRCGENVFCLFFDTWIKFNN